MIVIAGVPPEQRGSWTIAIVLAVTGWAASARVLRAQTLSLRNRDYVAAAKFADEKTCRIVFHEILPNLTVAGRAVRVLGAAGDPERSGPVLRRTGHLERRHWARCCTTRRTATRCNRPVVLVSRPDC